MYKIIIVVTIASELLTLIFDIYIITETRIAEETSAITFMNLKLL